MSKLVTMSPWGIPSIHSAQDEVTCNAGSQMQEIPPMAIGPRSDPVVQLEEGMLALACEFIEDQINYASYKSVRDVFQAMHLLGTITK